jgi:hypothetical protein
VDLNACLVVFSGKLVETEFTLLELLVDLLTLFVELCHVGIHHFHHTCFLNLILVLKNLLSQLPESLDVLVVRVLQLLV